MRESYNTPPVQTERKRTTQESFDYLNSLLVRVSSDISRELEERYRTQKLISSDCSIRMDAFYKLDTKQLEQDRKFTKEREREWSGIDDQKRRAELVRQYGLKNEATDQQIIERWSTERKKEKSKQLEMVITILLHKAFGDRYIVVRSSKYDDYAGGVDNVIVNKQTGAVICAVDDVRENERSDRRVEKDKEVLRKTRAGGAELAYGFTFHGDQIELKTLRNLPIFCLGLNEDEYDEIIKAIEYSGKDSNELNPTERKILEKILASIRGQRDTLLADPEVQKQSGIVESLGRVRELVG